MEKKLKEEVILQVALQLFLDNGYEATNIRMICKKAEVEAPTLYYYYTSKKGLFIAIIDLLWDDFVKIMCDIEGMLDSLNSKEKIDFLFLLCVYFAIYNMQYAKFYFRFTLFPPLGLHHEVNKFTEKIIGRFEELACSVLTESIEKKIMKNCDLKITIDFLWKFANLNIFERIEYNRVPTKKELYDLCSFFYNSMQIIL